MKYLLLITVIFALQIHAQQQNHRSRSELGVILGGSNYLGDLNTYNPLYNIKPAGGILYRYNVHSRLCWRGSLLYGNVGASDADASEALLRNRNLSFQSTIYEIGGGLEFSYLPFQLGHDKYRGTAYIMVGVSLFHMNPKTEYN